MDNESIQPVTEEKDLGVIKSEDLKPSKHCPEVVKKANMVLGMIKRHFITCDKDVIIPLYKVPCSTPFRILHSGMES